MDGNAPPKPARSKRGTYHKPNGPWKPAKATAEIRKRARASDLKPWWTTHLKERLAERDLIIGDVLHVLKYGFVYEQPKESSRGNLFKYLIDGKSPNSGNRELRVVAIPEPDKNEIKVVTVMWVDEK